MYHRKIPFVKHILKQICGRHSGHCLPKRQAEELSKPGFFRALVIPKPTPAARYLNLVHHPLGPRRIPDGPVKDACVLLKGIFAKRRIGVFFLYAAALNKNVYL